jgi:hypothetical protein
MMRNNFGILALAEETIYLRAMEKKNEKGKAPLALLNLIIEQLSVAPSGQVASKIRKKAVAFRKIQHTSQEKYDFIQEIGETEIKMVTDKMSQGDISSFVKVLCDLKPYYLRPE